MCKGICETVINCLFCCCNCCRWGSNSDTKDMAKYSRKLGKKYAKQSAGRKSGTSSTARYGTNWETLVNKVPMTPSQISDSMITKDINVDTKYKTREDIYKFVLSDYEFDMTKRIGKGAFGEVYKIKAKNSNQWFAVKIMRLMGENDMSRARFDVFKNEVFSLRKNSHKNIIKLVDHKMASSLFISFLIMEFADGGDLLHRLKQTYKVTNKGFPVSEAQTYFVQIANAIHFVHSNGLIHGDLKLENVLITKTKDGKQVIKVSDFGCARVAVKENNGIANVNRAFGTIAYMAPEQLRVYLTVNLKRSDLLRKATKAYNPIRADVWSLGVCLYRLLFYSYPFVYNNEKELESIVNMLDLMKRGPPFPPEAQREVKTECLDLIKEMMEIDKNKRIDMKGVVCHKWIHDSPYLDRHAVDERK